MSTKFRSFCFKRTNPGSEVTNHYPTQSLSDEFGWLVPIQDILNNINNNFHITVYAYAYESYWEDGFYFAQPDDRNNYIRVCEYTRTYDSTSGLNTFNISNQDLKYGINLNIAFFEELLDRGYTTVFVHPAAFQYYKFNQDPTADFTYGVPSSTIIKPVTIFENIPEPPSLPPYTLRLKFKDGVTPTFNYGTGVQVSSSPNIWDLTYVNTNWSALLGSQSDLLEVIDGNTTDVTVMNNMFGNCTSLTSVCMLDTSNVTSMASMFTYCHSLTSVPLFDTSNVTSMSSMFTWCHQSLTTVPLFDTSNVTNMAHMFENCYHLTTVSQFNTSKVTNMYGMFYNCTRLTDIPLFDTSNVTGMREMCYGCASLTTIPLFDTSKVTFVNSAFYNCYNVESGALALYTQLSTQTTPPTNHTSTFRNCGRDTNTGAAELAQIPSDWK